MPTPSQLQLGNEPAPSHEQPPQPAQAYAKADDTANMEISWFGNYVLFQIGEGEDAKSVKVWHLLLAIFLIGLLMMLFRKKKKRRK